MALAEHLDREADGARDLLDIDTLSAFELCRGVELDVVHRTLSDVFAYSGTVESLGPGSESSASVVQAVELSHMTVCTVRFGTETRIVLSPMLAYHVTVPITGMGICHIGARKAEIRPGLVSVAAPDEPLFIPHCDANVEVLCLKIRQDSFESELATMIGRPVQSMVRPKLDLDLSTDAGQSWLSVLGLMLHELATPDSLARTSRHHREQLERLVISSLLRAQSHDFSGEVWNEQAPVRWRLVKRAFDAIEDAPERPWSLTELAEVAGVSGRRLQQGFQAQLGMSPMRYLQNVRLERVHRDLLNDAGNVADVSMRWGFTHLGRFAGTYRDRYGESPSQTRRRSQSVAV